MGANGSPENKAKRAGKERFVVLTFTDYGNFEAGFWTTTRENAEKDLAHRVKMEPESSSVEFILAEALKHVNSSGEDVL